VLVPFCSVNIFLKKILLLEFFFKKPDLLLLLITFLIIKCRLLKSFALNVSLFSQNELSPSGSDFGDL